ncbi:MAG: class I SAM-dependent methyltransferase [Acidobacteria bacterium]|jgi:adenine-specific DNA methylase|nr:class I SAM-dependent methyltransferase [Acidobacteriota bacterium]
MQLIENQTEQKLRGGFYTPEPIADFILKWAFNGADDYDILEPSSGSGVFLEQIKKNNYKYNSITAIEINGTEAQKNNNIHLKNKSVLNMDFHAFCNSSNKQFDLVIGNPPYIRYQYFSKDQQCEAEKIFKRVNLRYSKLTNAWVSFLIGSSLLLKTAGKIGFVLPAEMLQVSYARTVREFLSTFFNKIAIVSFKKLVFPQIQQEVILLLCEKNQSQSHLIDHLELDDIMCLNNTDVSLLKQPAKKIDLKSSKWTFYFLDQREIDFLEAISKQNLIPTIGDYASVEVGITTGANDFFTVSSAIVERFSLQNYVSPLVGRSVQVNSLKFTSEDWENNVTSGAKAHILIFPVMEQLKNNEKVMEYLVSGMEKNLHKGYKCRIRDEWHQMPSLWIPDALFIRRNNVFPKLIINEAGAYTTDTMHRIKIKKHTDMNALAASFYNSLSFAFSEISGRSYGGGVLELMPSEVEKIRLPYHEYNSVLLNDIDQMMRKKMNIQEILTYTNDRILKDRYGFSSSEINTAHNIWKKLSHRRLNRK